MISGIAVVLPNQPPPQLSPADRSEIQYCGIMMTYILVKQDYNWIKDQHDLISAIRKIWNQEMYQTKHKKSDSVDYPHWKEPKKIAQILLTYFKHHKETEILLLFQLLRALCGR